MKLNMMYGANIPYPYDVPLRTMPDGTPGLWALIGAADAVTDSLQEGEQKDKIELSCGSKRDDEK